MYIDAAYCYQPSSMVFWLICHTSEPCENGSADRHAVWVEELSGPREPCVRWGSRSPMERAIFKRGKGRFIV